MLAVSSWAAAAGAANPLQPNSRWLVDYADDQCLLSRSYGPNDRSLVLSFEKLPMTTDVTLYLLKESDRRDLNFGKGQIGFGTGQPKETRFGAVSTIKLNVRRITVRLDQQDVERATRSGLIEVNIRGEVAESFAVPNFGAAFRALDACALDLGRLWGVPVEQQRLIQTPARPKDPLNKLFDPSDYPIQALVKGESGKAKARVSVDATGQPTHCALTRSTGSNALDATTCRILMKRARFNPALDANGRAVPGLFVTSVAWLVI